MTRRDQLKLRAASKETGKGKGRGKGKGKGKGKGRAKTNKDESADAAPPNESQPKKRMRSKAKASPPVVPDVEESEPKPKRARKSIGEAKAKATPKTNKAKSKPSKSPTIAPPAEGDVEEKPEVPKAKRPRKVATPQAKDESPEILDHLLGAFKAELSYHWKSGKTYLDGTDFTPQVFNCTTLSCYYNRSRPSDGCKAKSCIQTNRTNKEYANFSFNPKDVMNIGLAMKCATSMVSSLHTESSRY